MTLCYPQWAITHSKLQTKISAQIWKVGGSRLEDRDTPPDENTMQSICK